MMRISFGWLQAIWTRQDQAHPVAAASGVSPTHDIKRTRHRANIFWLIEFFPTGFFSLIKRTNERYEQAIGHSFLLRVSPTGFTAEVLTRPLGLSFTAFTCARGEALFKQYERDAERTNYYDKSFHNFSVAVWSYIGRTQTRRGTTTTYFLSWGLEGHFQRHLRKLRDEA
jgi:hypothetical protein